ncbi:hypothetical protein C8R43DRAFT_960349 [Mycena crocata]|nr:hypothetical protein C8R43DRAFT_960349 [Mycena crocata]
MDKLKNSIWSLPLFRKLDISFTGQKSDGSDDSGDFEGLPITAFNGPNVLREASLGEVPPSMITLPWDQLIKFTEKIYPIADCLEILRLTPNLTDCAFAAEDGDGTTPLPFIHSGLQSLTLFSATSSEDVNICSLDILELLTLPALHRVGLPTVPVKTGVTGAVNGMPSRPVEPSAGEKNGTGAGR